jgi:hypothetical protein
MSRRIALLALFLVSGLAGCVSYGDYYPARERYYEDGGYYYPADDGYGDYYEAPDDYYYDYYDDPYLYGYLPSWRLDRYACGAWYRCSPWWNSYYGRPYSGWSFSIGSHWSYGSWGWYGGGWSPWYDHRYYRPHPPRHRPGDRPGRPPPPSSPPPAGPPGNDDPRTVVPTPMPRTDFHKNRIGRPVITDPEGRPGTRIDRPTAPGTAEPVARPMPRPDFRDNPRKTPDYRRIERPTPAEPTPAKPTPRALPRPDFRDGPDAKPRYREVERPQPVRQVPDYSPRTRPEATVRPAPREVYRPASPPPAAPRQAPSPPRERPAPAPARQETRRTSQNGINEVED